jgi:hypothetical protein
MSMSGGFIDPAAAAAAATAALLDVMYNILGDGNVCVCLLG